jgi:hypothetical protein
MERITKAMRTELIKQWIVEQNFIAENIEECVDDDVSSFDEFIINAENEGYLEVEIIYYYKAMAYLSENDPSLQESLGIACAYGFDMESISSETLASLHASDKLENEIFERQAQLEHLFETFNELIFESELDELIKKPV